MKRALIAALTGLIVASIAGTGAARVAPATRTVEAKYVTPAAGASAHPAQDTKAYYFDCLRGVGCALIELEPKDRFAQLDIVDTAGQPVYGIVYRVPGFEQIGEICGSTEEPWPTGGATELLVHVVSGTCRDGGTSVATTGVVRATVTSRR
jgi:hypothetical protein